ncbi:cytochrome bd-I oxidase subunit CydX [Brevundimonas sp. DC300-4]
MWYFAWILGVGLAVAFGVLNGVWHEFHLFDEGDLGLSEPDRDGSD